MIDRPALRTEPQLRRIDRPRALDERSMRVLELGLAGMALLAAILLAVVR